MQWCYVEQSKTMICVSITSYVANHKSAEEWEVSTMVIVIGTANVGCYATKYKVIVISLLQLFELIFYAYYIIWTDPSLQFALSLIPSHLSNPHLFYPSFQSPLRIACLFPFFFFFSLSLWNSISVVLVSFKFMLDTPSTSWPSKVIYLLEAVYSAKKDPISYDAHRTGFLTERCCYSTLASSMLYYVDYVCTHISYFIFLRNLCWKTAWTPLFIECDLVTALQVVLALK